MRSGLRGCVVSLVLVACERGRGSVAPATAQPAALASRAESDAAERPRPGPGDGDQALVLRLRRGLDLPLKIAEVVRDGEAWLVAYTWDENEAWWREVQRDGEVAEVRAKLNKRRRQCEAAFRTPAENDPAAAGDEPDDPGFDVDTDDSMEQRSCWELAMASLVPREGPLEDGCVALGVARVTADKVESLWSSTGSCTAEPPAFALIDVAGAGWPQLVLQFHDVQWGSTRTGFQEAESADHLVILDPRPGRPPLLLEETLEWEQIVDDAWQFSGTYAHVVFTRKHVTIYRQKWAATDECAKSPAGWAIPDATDVGEDEYQPPVPCSVEWEVTRRSWDADSQKWSDKPRTLRPPKRPPVRDGFPLNLTDLGATDR